MIEFQQTAAAIYLAAGIFSLLGLALPAPWLGLLGVRLLALGAGVQGIAFASPEAETQLKGLISTDSKVFLLSSTGYIAESTRSIDTVIRVSSNGVSYLDWKER